MNEVLISPAELRKALAISASVIERRNTIPVLCMVKFDVTEGKARVSGTDLDMAASAQIETIRETGAPFGFLVNPRLIGSIAKTADQPVTISVDGEILSISSDGMSVKARNIIPPEDFPARHDMPPTGYAEIQEAVLEKAMRMTEHSISQEETRYYLSGSFFHDAGDGLLTIVSTDGRRLTKYATGIPWLPGHKAILPRKAHNFILRRLTKGGNKTIHVETTDELRMKFIGDGWELVTKCIDGTFPDYARVIPKPSDAINFTVTANALRRFPRSGAKRTAIAIHPDAGIMEIDDRIEGVTVTMPITGKGGRVGFNLEYLKTLAYLSATIRCSGYSDLDGFTVLSDDPNLTQVLMPMRV